MNESAPWLLRKATCRHCGQPAFWRDWGDERFRLVDADGKKHNRTCPAWQALTLEQREEIGRLRQSRQRGL